MQHLDRQGTEVVQARKFHFARIKHFLDSRHERNPNAVTELDAIEAKVDNLAQHFRAIGVAAGIPASRERDHNQTVAATGGAASACSATPTMGSQHCRRTRARTRSVIIPYAIAAIITAVGIPIASDKLVTPSPATGMMPTKLNMNTAETRPRK